LPRVPVSARAQPVQRTGMGPWNKWRGPASRGEEAVYAAKAHRRRLTGEHGCYPSSRKAITDRLLCRDIWVGSLSPPSYLPIFLVLLERVSGEILGRRHPVSAREMTSPTMAKGHARRAPVPAAGNRDSSKSRDECATANRTRTARCCRSPLGCASPRCSVRARRVHRCS
jgi:hypothetical protein